MIENALAEWASKLNEPRGRRYTRIPCGPCSAVIAGTSQSPYGDSTVGADRRHNRQDSMYARATPAENGLEIRNSIFASRNAGHANEKRRDFSSG